LGKLIRTGGTSRAVVALDPASGDVLWTHTENEGARAANAPRALLGRGLAYWTDGREEDKIVLWYLFSKAGKRCEDLQTAGAINVLGPFLAAH
jgi:hypothetical protein